MSEANEKPWYYAVDGQQVGPFSVDEIKVLVKDGKITVDTPVWKSGLEAWAPIADVPELNQPLHSATAAPSPEERKPEPLLPGALKLGGAREFKTENTDEDTADTNVDVQDLLKDQDKVSPKKQFKKKTDWLEVFGLTTLESGFFVITCLIMAILCAIFLVHWEAILMTFGLLWILTGNVLILYRLFTTSWQAGLTYLLLPTCTYLLVIFALQAWLGILALLAVPVVQLVILFIYLGKTWRGIVLIMAGYAALSIPVDTGDEQSIYSAKGIILNTYNEHMGRFISDLKNSSSDDD